MVSSEAVQLRMMLLSDGVAERVGIAGAVASMFRVVVIPTFEVFPSVSKA